MNITVSANGYLGDSSVSEEGRHQSVDRRDYVLLFQTTLGDLDSRCNPYLRLSYSRSQSNLMLYLVAQGPVRYGMIRDVPTLCPQGIQYSHHLPRT